MAPVLSPVGTTRPYRRGCERNVFGQRISAERLATKVGKRMRVLVDSVEADGTVIARSAADAPEIDGLVRISGPGLKLKAGDWADVEITSADAYDLHAKPALAS